MFGKKEAGKPTFTKASTPEGLRKQRAAIRDYYVKKKEGRNKAKGGKAIKKAGAK